MKSIIAFPVDSSFLSLLATTKLSTIIGPTPNIPQAYEYCIFIVTKAEICDGQNTFSIVCSLHPHVHDRDNNRNDRNEQRSNGCPGRDEPVIL
jgi:hypothetical protein